MNSFLSSHKLFHEIKIKSIYKKEIENEKNFFLVHISIFIFFISKWKVIKKNNNELK